MHAISGGADGADSRWLAALHEHCEKITICTFLGHRLSKGLSSLKPTPRCQLLSQREREAAAPAITRAALRLGKKEPGPGSRNMIMRNHVLASMADCIIAIGKLVPTEQKESVGVDGGTGWTIQMFADMFEPAPADAPLNVFLFDGADWLQLSHSLSAASLYSWKPASVGEAVDAALQNGRCGFIGSRDLTPFGVAAIRQFASELRRRAKE